MSRVSCRPSHLNVDRFHQPCLLPWRSPYCQQNTAGCWAGTDEDCRPRPTWRPLTLCGQPGSPSFATHWKYCRADWTVPRQDVSSSFAPPACATSPEKVFAHTQVRDPHESAAACCSHALGTPSHWPAACPEHPGSLDMTSMTFAAVICAADDPCSVNTA